MTSFRSRNRGRKLLQTPLLRACRAFSILTALLFMIAYEVRPGGRLRGLHLMTFPGPNGKSSRFSWHQNSDILHSWRKAFCPSVVSAVAQSKCRQASSLTRRPISTKRGNADAAAAPSPVYAQCAIIPHLFRIDPALPFVAARAAQILWAHLRAAAGFHSLEWCPSFSSTGWEVGRHVSYFRGVPRSIAEAGAGAGTSIDVYCHSTPTSYFSGGKESTIEPLSQSWWETMRCYASPVERWIASWSNCTGSLRVRNLQPPHLLGNNLSTTFRQGPCSKTCRMLPTAPARSFHLAAITALRKGNGMRHRLAMAAQQRELVRIRRQVSAASAQGVREKECGYERDVWDVAFHVRNSAGLKLVVELMHRMEATMAAKSNFGLNRLRFHMHLEIMPMASKNAVMPSFVTDHIAVRSGSGILLGALKDAAPGSPSHAIRMIPSVSTLALQNDLSWGPVRMLECLRIADALVLTQGSLSVFAAIPAILGRASPVALPQADLDTALKIAGVIEAGVSRKEASPARASPVKAGTARHMSLELMAIALASGGDDERARWHGFDAGSDPGYGLLLRHLLLGRTGELAVGAVSDDSLSSLCEHAPVVHLVGGGRFFGDVPRTGVGAPLMNLDAGALVEWGRQIRLLGHEVPGEVDEAAVFSSPEACSF